MNSELIDKVYESCFAQQLEELDELFFLQVRPFLRQKPERNMCPHLLEESMTAIGTDWN